MADPTLADSPEWGIGNSVWIDNNLPQPHRLPFTNFLLNDMVRSMKKIYLLPFFVAVLSGCGSLETQFKQASEPAENQPRARLRIIANSLVKAVPGKSCIDWSSPGAGTVFGGGFGSSGYRGRTLNMPYPPNVRNSEMGELYVSADKPITLAFLTTPEGISSGGKTYHCQVSGTFIPEKKQELRSQSDT